MYIIGIKDKIRKVEKMQSIHFVGIIAENKNIQFIKKMLNPLLKNVKIICITNENIDNLKNVTFDIIVVFNSLKKLIFKLEVLKQMLIKTRWIILNSDIKENIECIENLTLNVITFGFNSKATITTSSIQEDEIFVCIQRSIKIDKNNQIEPQEIKINYSKEKIEDYAVCVMGIVGILKIQEYF